MQKGEVVLEGINPPSTNQIIETQSNSQYETVRPNNENSYITQVHIFNFINFAHRK